MTDHHHNTSVTSVFVFLSFLHFIPWASILSFQQSLSFPILLLYSLEMPLVLASETYPQWARNTFNLSLRGRSSARIFFSSVQQICICDSVPVITLQLLRIRLCVLHANPYFFYFIQLIFKRWSDYWFSIKYSLVPGSDMSVEIFKRWNIFCFEYWKWKLNYYLYWKVLHCRRGQSHFLCENRNIEYLFSLNALVRWVSNGGMDFSLREGKWFSKLFSLSIYLAFIWSIGVMTHRIWKLSI
jgi:hypothetical protein